MPVHLQHPAMAETAGALLFSSLSAEEEKTETAKKRRR
jgi:hypothetical protein